ncbi:MAG: hypothetical protein J5817_08610 [Treponema sp.]|nr:hypothetical protein [Treponema sp.]
MKRKLIMFILEILSLLLFSEDYLKLQRVSYFEPGAEYIYSLRVSHEEHGKRKSFLTFQRIATQIDSWKFEPQKKGIL